MKMAKGLLCYFITLTVIGVLFVGLMIFIILNRSSVTPEITTETETTTQLETESDTEPTIDVEIEKLPASSSPIIPEPDTEPETETEPEPVTYTIAWSGYKLTEEEFNLICTTVYCEAGGQSSKEQYMVALAILNQISSGKFGRTVRKVIYKKNNFSVTYWPNFEQRGYTKKVKQAVLLALEKNPHPRNMYYFRTKRYHKWAKKYMKVGVFYFSTSK